MLEAFLRQQIIGLFDFFELENRRLEILRVARNVNIQLFFNLLFCIKYRLEELVDNSRKFIFTNFTAVSG